MVSMGTVCFVTLILIDHPMEIGEIIWNVSQVVLTTILFFSEGGVDPLQFLHGAKKAITPNLVGVGRIAMEKHLSK